MKEYLPYKRILQSHSGPGELTDDFANCTAQQYTSIIVHKVGKTMYIYKAKSFALTQFSESILALFF